MDLVVYTPALALGAVLGYYFAEAVRRYRHCKGATAGERLLLMCFAAAFSLSVLFANWLVYAAVSAVVARIGEVIEARRIIRANLVRAELRATAKQHARFSAGLPAGQWMH